MLAAGALQTVRLFFLGPIAEQFAAQRLKLLNGARFGFIRGTALGQGLIHQVGDGMEAGQDVRTRGQTLLQGARVGC